MDITEVKDWMYCEDTREFCEFCHDELYRIDEITYVCQNEHCPENFRPPELREEVPRR